VVAAVLTAPSSLPLEPNADLRAELAEQEVVSAPEIAPLAPLDLTAPLILYAEPQLEPVTQQSTALETHTLAHQIKFILSAPYADHRLVFVMFPNLVMVQAHNAPQMPKPHQEQYADPPQASVMSQRNATELIPHAHQTPSPQPEQCVKPLKAPVTAAQPAPETAPHAPPDLA